MSVNINNVYSVYFEGYIPLLLLDFLFWCFYFFFYYYTINITIFCGLGLITILSYFICIFVMLLSSLFTRTVKWSTAIQQFPARD